MDLIDYISYVPMGRPSQADWETLRKVAEELKKIAIENEVEIVTHAAPMAVHDSIAVNVPTGPGTEEAHKRVLQVLKERLSPKMIVPFHHFAIPSEEEP